MEEPRLGAILDGKLELREELGRGGMGSVWRARDLRLQREVAIKFIHSALVEEAGPRSVSLRARFEREARAAAQLRTRHVTQVYDFGVDGDTQYIVMELLVGESLSRRLARLGRLSFPEVVRLGVETCRGLVQAHEAGIVHRDLKPANLFFAQIDGEDVVKILDFGIAKMVDAQAPQEDTAAGSVLGSPHYMSPEQVRGMSVDGRSDLWSLGVILFRCLTGVKPFDGPTMADVIAKIVSDELPRVSDAAPGVPAGTEAFFARALARNGTQRFQSAAEMAHALSALLAPGLRSPSLSSFPEVTPPPSGTFPSLQAAVTPSEGASPAGARHRRIGAAMIAGGVIGLAALGLGLAVSSSSPAPAASAAEAPVPLPPAPPPPTASAVPVPAETASAAAPAPEPAPVEPTASAAAPLPSAARSRLPGPMPGRHHRLEGLPGDRK